MTIKANDPRLTAYALGELDDSEEVLETEAAIEADPRLRAEVEAIGRIASLAAAGYSRQPTAELSQEEREAALRRPRRLRLLLAADRFRRLSPAVRAAVVVLALGTVWAVATGMPGRLAFASYYWIDAVRSTSSQKDIAKDQLDPGEAPSLKEVVLGYEEKGRSWEHRVLGTPYTSLVPELSETEGRVAVVERRYGLDRPFPQRMLQGVRDLLSGPDESPATAPADAPAQVEAPYPAGEDSSVDSQPTYYLAPPPTPEPEVPATGADGQTKLIPQEPGRKIVKNGDMTIEVDRVDIALGRITAAATQMGGYVLETGSDYEEQYEIAGATVKVAVPVANFEAMLERVREVAVRVIEEYASGRDATQEYVDLQSKLANLEATQARIREFLDQADSVEEALRVNSELTEIEGQISQIKGQLQYIEQRAAYSTLTVVVRQQPPEHTATATATPYPTATPVPWQPTETARDAYGALSGVLQGLANMVIWLVIFVAPLAAPFAAVAWFWRKR